MWPSFLGSLWEVAKIIKQRGYDRQSFIFTVIHGPWWTKEAFLSMKIVWNHRKTYFLFMSTYWNTTLTSCRIYETVSKCIKKYASENSHAFHNLTTFSDPCKMKTLWSDQLVLGQTFFYVMFLEHFRSWLNVRIWNKK